jgi:GWxTD domain-containing protein
MKAARHGVNRRSDIFAVRRMVVLGLFFAMAATGAFGQKKEKLEKTYKQWLDEEVVYIITKDERDNFLKLASNEARDKFIEKFWEIRNPNPGSPTNEFRDEHYKRIAFANSRFNVGSVNEGWRTDRGHAYILLGPPNQKQVYRNAANLYPIEIWFYSTGLTGLPNFFYLMFYDRDVDGGYRFYSPYMDGPDKLTTGSEAINDPASAYRMIQNSIGPEVARISLTLIPGEPVDPSTGTRTMQSDILLASIRGYNNLPAYRQEIAQRYQLKEMVSTRMVLSGRNLDVLTLPVRDSRGLTRLDYSIHLKNASDMTLTKEDDGRFSYGVGMSIRVFTIDNKLIFSQEKQLRDTMDKQRMEAIADRTFGYEGLLPLPPGKYRVSFALEDWAGKKSFQTEREVVIPQPDANSFIVPGILPFSGAEEVPDPIVRDLTPFSMGGVRFHPLPESSPTVRQDMPLQFTYQIWANAQDPRSLMGKKLIVDYGLGQPAVAGTATTLRDEVGMEQFDVTGSLVSGKRMSLADKPSGNYVLSVSLQRSDTGQKSFATAHFRVYGELDPKKTWEVDEPGIIKDAETGVLDEQRGLALIAQGNPDEARKWLLRSIKLDSANDQARTALVEAYFTKGDYAAVRSLFNDVGVTPKTNAQTLVRIAESLEHLGESQKAETILRDAIGFHPEEARLYLALADANRQAGDLKAAAENEKKGKSFLGAN